ncbi:MAG: tetratricopeptide repeat protein [Ilumatobacter sp.]|nr:tetratricopeptide repeat protein [Ilumatobacter sp.]
MIDRAIAAPSGNVTFLFTDLEGSTALWERVPDAMNAALAEHDRRMHAVFAERNGYVFTTAGDSFAVAFDSPTDALAAAVDAQRALREPCGDITIRVRIGLHVGTATARDGDYFGAVVNRAARLMSSAHGGQIIVSGATAALLDPLPEDTTLVDCGEHRLKDLLRPEHIFQVRHPELDDDFPPLRTLEGPSINLPPQLTSFVGREQELADVGALLADHRLVTMVGSGGAGKTRLALQVAADSLEFFPDGIRFVELAGVADPQYVCDEIAVNVGAREIPDEPFVKTIASKIGAQRLLLVLDNCEHLIDEVADVAGDLLQSCPGLKILATSRERLNIGGEAAYRVPSLSMPDLEPQQTAGGSGLPHWVARPTRPVALDLKQVLNTDAVQLFTERAMLAKPDFAVTESNVNAVVAICVRLDGIPLALELAAARLRALSPEQIATRLDERFRLLAGSSRGSLERHRTLAATIAWSYEHLTEPEQAVFRRASVFSGTFDLNAAEHVCVGDDIEDYEVLDHVTALLDKSMLVAEDNGEGETWYRLLESMRHFGATTLTEHGEEERTHIAHATYFVEFAARLETMWRGDQLPVALAALDRDVENFRAALRYAIDQHRHLDAAHMIGSIGYLWYAGGTFVEGIDWCRELFDDEPELPDDVLAAALHAYSLLLGSWSDPETGTMMLMREVELRRRIGDPGRLAAALNNLGNTLHDLGRAEEGEATLHEAVEQYRIAGEPATLALATIAFGYKDQGRYDEAAALFTEAVDEATAADNRYGIALGRSGLGELATYAGRTDDARSLLEEARAAFETLGVRPGVNNIDLTIALADITDGKIVDAAGRLAAALEEPDIQWYAAAKFWMLQLVAEIIDDRSLAARLLATAKRHYDEVGSAQPLWTIEHFERVAATLDDHPEASPDDSVVLPPLDAIAAARDALYELLGTMGSAGTDGDDPDEDGIAMN